MRLTRLQLVAGGLVACQAMVLFWAFRWSPSQVLEMFDVFPAVDASSVVLEPQTAEIKNVKAGALFHGKAEIVNTSNRSIELTEPKADCGCLEATIEPTTLEPKGRAQLRFTFRAPTSPQTLRRLIKFQTKKHDIAWALPIVAEVEAQFWAEPSQIKLTLDRDGRASQRIYVHNESDIERIASSSQHLTLQTIALQEDESMVDLSIDASRDGSETISIYRKGVDEPVLTIPVVWQCRPSFVIRPSQIVVKKSERNDAEIASFFVLADQSIDVDSVRAEPLVPWIHRLTKERVSEKKVKLRVFADWETIPIEISGPIVRLTEPEHKFESFVDAVR